MSPDALWSFEFMDLKEHRGAGVVVFYSNKVLGGNDGFTYIGEYLLKGNEISFKVDVKRFNEHAPGIYKDEYTLIAKGEYNDLDFVITGSPIDNKDLLLAIHLTRQQEISG
jgi:hypothetical protein